MKRVKSPQKKEGYGVEASLAALKQSQLTLDAFAPLLSTTNSLSTNSCESVQHVDSQDSVLSAGAWRELREMEDKKKELEAQARERAELRKKEKEAKEREEKQKQEERRQQELLEEVARRDEVKVTQQQEERMAKRQKDKATAQAAKELHWAAERLGKLLEAVPVSEGHLLPVYPGQTMYIWEDLSENWWPTKVVSVNIQTTVGSVNPDTRLRFTPPFTYHTPTEQEVRERKRELERREGKRRELEELKDPEPDSEPDSEPDQAVPTQPAKKHRRNELQALLP